MSNDALLPGREVPDTTSPSVQNWRGVIDSEPVDADDQVYVRIPGADNGQHRYGPCPFNPRGVALPSVGDPCLIAFDDDDDPWVVSWYPA